MALKWEQVAVCAVIGAAVVSGCAISNPARELECSDGVDNDGDGPADCDDLDCQALSACARARPASEPDAGARAPGLIGDAFVGTPPVDAGSSAPPSTVEPEEPPAHEEPPPATEEPPAEQVEDPPPEQRTCDQGCGENQTCVEGLCLDNDVVVVELWDVTRIDVTAPASIADGTCLDTDCLFYVPTICSCMPDLQVKIEVDHEPDNPDNTPELAGATSVRRDLAVTSWRTPDITLGLLPSSAIVMHLYDVDGDSAEQIFECTLPAAPVLQGEALSCTARLPADSLLPAPYTITAQVMPTQVPTTSP